MDSNHFFHDITHKLLPNKLMNQFNKYRELGSNQQPSAYEALTLLTWAISAYKNMF